MNSGLYVIEGLDSTGKQTQTELLYKRLLEEGHNVKKVTFPNYESDSSIFVKMYLNGEFGSKPNDVNPYVASTFYAVDRFASYKKEWEQFYREGGIIIADRYVSSNMIYQASKIEGFDQKDKFLDWLWNLEYIQMGLPIPTTVIFLDVPIKYSLQLMKDRKNKITNESEKDIHENNTNYLMDSYNNSQYIAQKYKWDKINCINNNQLRKINDIHDEIYKLLFT